MKAIYFALALLLWGCAASSDQKFLQHTVSILAADSMQGRLSGTIGEQKAARYLAQAFADAGLQPYQGKFLHPFEVEGKIMTNVAGVIPGSTASDEIIILSAHYDHIGIVAPIKGDSIANGADDNASGVAGMLLLANKLSKANPERTVVIVAFSGEEIGLLGSIHFAKQLPNPDKVVFALNFEMLGKVATAGKSTFFLTGFEMSDLGLKMQEQLKNTPYRLIPDPYTQFGLFYRSDNISLAMLGIPAHTISSDAIDRDPHYHKPSDEAKTLSFENMNQVVQGIYKALLPLTNKGFYPTRIQKH